MIANNSSLMERLGFWAGAVLMVLLAFSTAAPYACAWQGAECHIPDNLIRLLDQNQNTIQNLAIYLFGFLFGTSVGKRSLEGTIDTLARTAQTAGAALSGTSEPASLDVPPGESATATAKPDGGITITPGDPAP